MSKPTFSQDEILKALKGLGISRDQVWRLKSKLRGIANKRDRDRLAENLGDEY